MSRRPKQALTPEDAVTFRHGVRVGSIIRLAIAVQERKASGQHPGECACEPYSDFFTFARWKAQGRSIRKGSRSFGLPVIRDDQGETTEPQDETRPEARPVARRPRPRFWTAHVFSRCMTCEPGAERAVPWPYTVDDDTRQAERTRRIDTSETAEPVQGWAAVAMAEDD